MFILSNTISELKQFCWFGNEFYEVEKRQFLCLIDYQNEQLEFEKECVRKHF